VSTAYIHPVLSAVLNSLSCTVYATLLTASLRCYPPNLLPTISLTLTYHHHLIPTACQRISSPSSQRDRTRSSCTRPMRCFWPPIAPVFHQFPFSPRFYFTPGRPAQSHVTEPVPRPPSLPPHQIVRDVDLWTPPSLCVIPRIIRFPPTTTAHRQTRTLAVRKVAWVDAAVDDLLGSDLCLLEVDLRAGCLRQRHLGGRRSHLGRRSRCYEPRDSERGRRTWQEDVNHPNNKHYRYTHLRRIPFGLEPKYPHTPSSWFRPSNLLHILPTIHLSHSIKYK
jgi:hypothetical protein